METEDNSYCNSDSPSGRVQCIRQQWALHEDEALAHRLQDEEITQHYAGNRTRNAIVREDGPRAREEQRREEQEALEQRLRHLSLLQRQAEDDARVAQELAKKYQINSDDASFVPDSLEPNGKHDSIDRRIGPHEPGHSVSKVDVSLLGATSATYHHTSSSTTHEKTYFDDEDLDELNEEDLRILQEQRDAEYARKLQEELEQFDKDKRLAVEAQDRELAKMLYEKEKAKIKRAKERARLKAEMAEAANSGSYSGTSSDPENRLTLNPNSDQPSPRKKSELPSPPRVPGKTPSPKDNPIGFKAHPKPLPPQPFSPSHGPGPSTRSYISDDPVPPYMPIHGFNRTSPSKRSSK